MTNKRMIDHHYRAYLLKKASARQNAKTVYGKDKERKVPPITLPRVPVPRDEEEAHAR